MITFQFSADKSIDYINKQLGELSGKSKIVLARSVNETAKKARVLLSDKAREAYEVKKSGVTKSMTVKKATQANPAAIITVKGRPIELKAFKVSPASYRPAKRPRLTKGRAVRGNAMKPLTVDGIKAFIVRYASGHVSVAVRSSSKRLPLKTLYSVSAPNMVGSDKLVYGVVRPRIESILQQQIDRQINRVLKGKG